MGRLTPSKRTQQHASSPQPRLTAVVPTVGLSVMLALAGALSSCTTQPSSESANEFRPTATVQDIMLSMIDPDADIIWEAVATIVYPDRTEERRPHTDEDWARLRHAAIRLVEATNLLLIEDRAVADPGVVSENPGIELEPSEIGALIAEDRATWTRLVHDLHDISQVMLDAVNDRDADRIFDEGGRLDVACEICHQRYWYPGDVRPQGSAAAAPAPVAEKASDGTALQASASGTIQGRVALSGELPGNAVIRMGVDPMCKQVTEGKLMLQERVLTDADGGLANVFVQLTGTFPETPVPTEPVVLGQRDCVFVPRVVGARAGQEVQITNRDPLLHNLHSLSTTTNSFNVGQPLEGMVHTVRLEEEDGMLQIKCDLHRWMTEFIGVVTHPYFAVSTAGGRFTIEDVPAGTHTVQAWHEQYGVLMQTVSVEPGATTDLNLTYPEEAG